MANERTAQSWLITGTSSGFGLELTRRLLQRGDRVAAVMRKPERLAHLADEHGPALWRRAADLTDEGAVRDAVAEAWAAFGTVDVVVSNGGYGLFGALEELSPSDMRRQVETNVMGPLTLFHAAVPLMREQGGGKLVQVSSMAGQMAAAGMSLYHLSKWAIEGLMEALHHELAPFGIAVCLVEPGSARTAFGGSSMTIGEPLAAYDDTPAAAIRGRRERSRASIPGDPSRMVSAILDAAHADVLPRRLILGSDAQSLIVASLRARLEEAEAQERTARATDADDYAPDAAR